MIQNYEIGNQGSNKATLKISTRTRRKYIFVITENSERVIDMLNHEFKNKTIRSLDFNWYAKTFWNFKGAYLEQKNKGWKTYNIFEDFSKQGLLLEIDKTSTGRDSKNSKHAEEIDLDITEQDQEQF